MFLIPRIIRPVAFLALGMVPVHSLVAAPIISEFMAANKSTLVDEDGAYSDWIEIHNPDATAVDLTGWRLTDNASSLSKWTFPAVTLEPGEFRIVFASLKNRINPAANLHTNFALGAGGEYLALISPLGVTSTEFSPIFPPQENDVSYGAAFSSTNLITTGQSARYLVPSSGTPTTATWTAAAFNDGTWASGATGLGFGLLVPGMLVKEVQTNFDMGTLAALDAALAGTALGLARHPHDAITGGTFDDRATSALRQRLTTSGAHASAVGAVHQSTAKKFVFHVLILSRTRPPDRPK